MKWASFNLGAIKPEDYGDYFAWGETEPYYCNQDPLIWKDGKESGYDWTSYKWCRGTLNTMTKYCPFADYGYDGYTDGKTVLDLDDDAAHANWGGSWRLPTDAEWTELRQNCTWTWTTQNGVNGYKVTSYKTGYTDKSIFLPAAGHRDFTILYNVGSIGLYWSSSLLTGNPGYAWDVSFNSGNVGRNGYLRYDGFSVRPVSE